MRKRAQCCTQLSVTFENVRETRLAERDGLLLLKSPSTTCKTEEAGWSCDSNPSSHSALVIPIKSSGFLCLWTQAQGQHWHCAGAGTPSLAYTLLQQNTSSKGTFIGVSVSVGLCFWEDQNHKSLFSKASRYPLKPINHVRTGWALRTYSHAILGNETVPNKGLWTHIFWLQEETNLSLKLFCSCLCQVSLFIISGTAPSVKVSKRWQPNGDIPLRVHL